MQVKGHSLFMQLDDVYSMQHRTLLAVIVLSGLLLRLYSLYWGEAYTYFAIRDEVLALKYGLGLLAGDPVMYYLGQPLLNQGQVPGPLWAMFVATLYLLGGQTATGALFIIALLNSLVIYLVYRLAVQLFSPRYALFTAMLYALSPWVVYYAVGLYNPIPTALLGVLLYLALWQTLHKDDSRQIFWVVLITAAIPQFHMIGIFTIPAILLLLYLTPHKINLHWFALGAAMGLLLYLPYLIGDALNDWQNTHALLSGDKAFSPGILKIITIPIAMLSNQPGQWAGYSFDEFKLYGNQYFGSYIVLLIINVMSIVLAATFVFSLIRKVIRCLKENNFRLKVSYQKQPELFFLAVLIFLPLLVYTLTGRHYSTRYSILIFPLLFLLPAFFLAGLSNSKLKNIILYAVFFLLVFSGYMMLTFYHNLNERIYSSEILMPSFTRLDSIYPELREHAGSNLIEINTEGYISQDNRYTNIAAEALSVYIDSHEQYLDSRQQTGNIKSYTLLNAKQAATTLRPVVYRDHSIIIVE